MRFNVTCDGGLIEMVGEEIVMPNSDDQFVLHCNPLDEDNRAWEPFRVTHVKTGSRLGGGKTIDEAIAVATKNMLSVSPDEFKVIVEEKLNQIAELKLERVA